MLVVIATQGRMTMQLPQSTRVVDLHDYFDGPVTVEVAEVEWVQRQVTGQPRRTDTQADRLIALVRQTGGVSRALAMERLDLCAGQLEGAMSYARRTRVWPGERMVSRDGVIQIVADATATSRDTSRRRRFIGQQAPRHGPNVTLEDVEEWT